MRKTTGFAVLAVAFAAGCGNPARSYSAPAPANSLECALRTTAALGYNPVGGGVSSGYIKLARRHEASMGAAVAARLPGVGEARRGDYITVTGAGETLRIELVGYDKNNNPVKPSSEAEGHAEAIISACGNPASR